MFSVSLMVTMKQKPTGTQEIKKQNKKNQNIEKYQITSQVWSCMPVIPALGS
jgi:hypothetical protein